MILNKDFTNADYESSKLSILKSIHYIDSVSDEMLSKVIYFLLPIPKL